jgi:Sugar-transfer associated ATP-grasp
MNILLYYPRLIAALVLRRPPRSHATLQHWANAQLFWSWNRPWGNPLDTFGMSVVRIYALAKKSSFAAWHWKARLMSLMFRVLFLSLLFVWPILAAIVAFRARGRRLARWNSLVNQLRFFLSESWSHGIDIAEPLDCTDFLAPLLYIYRRTGRRIPDRKDETVDCCRRLGIPTPRVLGADDVITPGQSYIVKPVDGCRAVGIHYTDQPQAYLGQPGVIVQEIARNPLSLRRLWGTNTLACFRFITAIRDDGDYEVVACILRVPIGDSPFDNTCKGNGYAAVNASGVLQRLFTDKGSRAGYSHHLTTGEKSEGFVIDDYADCAALAVTVHRRLAAGMPVLNSDIASTDGGPTLVEINRAPGQYEQMYCNDYSEKCVRAICRMVGLVHHDVAAWLQLSHRAVADDFSGMAGRDNNRRPDCDDLNPAEQTLDVVDHEPAVAAGTSV